MNTYTYHQITPDITISPGNVFYKGLATFYRQQFGRAFIEPSRNSHADMLRAVEKVWPHRGGSKKL